jgi:hypothetical protein
LPDVHRNSARNGKGSTTTTTVIKIIIVIIMESWDSSVEIAAGYVLDGRGSISGWG